LAQAESQSAWEIDPDGCPRRWHHLRRQPDQKRILLRPSSKTSILSAAHRARGSDFPFLWTSSVGPVSHRRPFSIRAGFRGMSEADISGLGTGSNVLKRAPEPTFSLAQRHCTGRPSNQFRHQEPGESLRTHGARALYGSSAKMPVGGRGE